MVKKEAVEVTNGETEVLLSTRTAAVLVEKLKEFRQSYNRTHGQVCEFFEQAHIVEKLCNHSSGPSKTANKQERNEEEYDEQEEDGCNEQKTWSIKQKLNSWRAVMREVVSDVCPNLQLENQPDINPGLMKHVLDEIRKLKTELAFQHNTILELNHQLESHQSKNQRKDRLIERLLLKSREIRLEGCSARAGNQGEILSGLVSSKEDTTTTTTTTTPIHQQQPLTSFDQDELLQFGSIDCLSDLHFELKEMRALCADLNQEFGVQVDRAAEQGCVLPPQCLKAVEVGPETHSHPLPTKIADSSSDPELKSHFPSDINKPESADITTINDVPMSPTATPSAESTLGRNPESSSVDVSAGNAIRKNHRTVLSVCGRLCFAYMACKFLHRRSRISNKI